MKYEIVRLGDYVRIKTGKLDANAASENGKYMFFTCSVEPLKIDFYEYDCECVLIAGNGDLNVKYYEGKFNAYQRTYIVESTDNTVLFTKYIYFFMQIYIKYLREKSIGGVIKYIKLGDLTEIKIPLPPLDIQKKIADVLDKVQELIEKRKEQIEKMDDLLKSIFLEMFGDPVTNPKGWEWGKMKEICELKLGKMLDSKKQTGQNKKKYLGNRNVLWGKFDLENLLEMDFSAEEEQKYNLQNGDLLICEGGEVGKCAIWRNNLQECYYQKALHRARLNKEKVVPEFLFFLMKYYAENNGLKDYVTSATIAHLTSEKLKELPIPLPHIFLQNKFAAIVEKTEAEKEKMEASLAKLEGNFQALMQRAFKGELF